MICPVCGGESEVLDSRPAAENGRADYSPGARRASVIRRRRICIACQSTFITLERYWAMTRPRKEKP